jgi:hypothetical protein
LRSRLRLGKQSTSDSILSADDIPDDKKQFIETNAALFNH